MTQVVQLYMSWIMDVCIIVPILDRVGDSVQWRYLSRKWGTFVDDSSSQYHKVMIGAVSFWCVHTVTSFAEQWTVLAFRWLFSVRSMLS